MTEEHLKQCNSFGTTQTDGKAAEKITAQVALLLPEDYGVGLRHLNEKIWGLWQPDNDYQQIWQNINKLSDRYGLKLDIIYNDGKIDPAKIYKNVYLWNQTIP